MINKEQLRAKAQFFIAFNNPGLKSGVIDNETFVDFSPKLLLFEGTSIAYIRK